MIVLTRYAARILALTLVAGSYAAARLPTPGDEDHAAQIARFHFESSTLPLPGVSRDAVLPRIRTVHPSFRRIAGWISTVGAGVALADLDGDGLPNDVCHVEPRTDDVIVSSAIDGRYAPFALSMRGLRYDASHMAPMGCLPGDLDEDGQLDLIVYFWGRPPAAFLHVGAAGAALAPERYRAVEIVGNPAEEWYTNAATRADVDGDGHADLIIGNYFPDRAGVLDAHGTGLAPMQASMSRASNGGGLRLLRWVGAASNVATPGATASIDAPAVASSAAPAAAPTVAPTDVSTAASSVAASAASIAAPPATSPATAGAASIVRFEEIPLPSLPDAARGGWTLAIAATDLDADLLPEIYMANDFGPDVLLHNESRPGAVRLRPVYGRRTFAMPASHVLGCDSFKGMGIDVNDLDGDGRLDLFVSNIAAEYALEESHLLFAGSGSPSLFWAGEAPFRDRSEALGLSRSAWAWDGKLDDFDNDGHREVVQANGFLKGSASRWPELHELATANDQLLADPRAWPRFNDGDDLSGHAPNRFWVRHGDGRYYDIAEPIGLGMPSVSRGIATADIDGDGALDMAIANQWQPSTLWRNRAPHPGAFLGLHLRFGPPGAPTAWQPGHQPATSDPPAWGVSARVVLADGRVLVAASDGGNGHGGKRSGDLHLGLGDVDRARPVSVALAWRGRDGAARQRTLSLTPGWYSVTLGS